MNYKVSDFIIRIKNATLAKRRRVELPYSKLNKEIGKILVKEHFLRDIKEEVVDNLKVLIGEIRYEKRVPVLNDVAVISKPSLRVYSKSKSIPRTQGGFGVSILSTNQGVMTEREAKKKGVGGELLFKIW